MYKTVRADRIKNTSTYSHWVYGLYHQNKLIYIGVTADPAARGRNHSKTKTFDEFRLIKGFSNRERAERFETLCINYFPNLINIAKLKPRDDFEKYIKGKQFQDDLKGFLGTRNEEYDFELLNNKSIQRRIRWEASLQPSNPE